MQEQVSFVFGESTDPCNFLVIKEQVGVWGIFCERVEFARPSMKFRQTGFSRRVNEEIFLNLNTKLVIFIRGYSTSGM